MGTGKLAGPPGGGERESGDDGQPLSIAEIAAELVNAGKTLVEVAGLDDVQMRSIFFRPRDEFGNLVRTGGSEAKATRIIGFEAMFRDVWTKRVGPEAAEQRWQDYLERTPSMVRFLARRRRKKART